MMIKKIFLGLFILLMSASTYSQLGFSDVSVDNEDQENGLIRINWTLSSPTEEWDSILIYRKIEDQNFNLRANVPYNNISFVDDSLCGVNVVYALSLYQDGISTDSTTLGSVFENDAAPEIPILYSLNYVNDSIELHWKKTEDETAIGYTIFQWKNDIFDSILFINNPDANSFRFGDGVSPCNRHDSLLLITYDVCAGSPNQLFDYFQSLTLIENLSNDKCQRNVTINFSEYIPAEGLNQRILEHEIWASENGSNSVLIDSIPAGTTQYIHDSITSGSKYKYTIKTFLEIGGNTVSSICCPDSILTKEIPLPGFFEITHVTVTGENLVEVEVRAENVSINGYAVYRNTVGEVPQRVAQLNPQAQETWTFTDSTANPEIESYFYDVKVIDECSKEAIDANTTSRSIHLSVETDNNTNFLEWNAYEGWAVDSYMIYRFGRYHDTIHVTTVSGGTFTLPDTPAFNPNVGQWQYFVVAKSVEGDTESYSNVASANHNTIFQVPSAFRPEGETHIFKPFFVNLTTSNYKFLIYNRWGQLIFESENPQAGWDGTFEGSYVQSGTYIYYISYEDNNGEIKSIKGSVLVIR